MLRKRLITVLTFNEGVLFRTKKFVPDYRYTLNFVDAWSVDEIVVLDVTRSRKEREHFYRVVSDFAGKCFVPLAAGGGVRNIEEFKMMLKVGADKVVVNTQAFLEPEFITRAAQLFGAQCVVVSIDAARNDKGEYEVYIENGSVPTGIHPADWARKAQTQGAGEIMVTSIDRDGSLEGYDNELGSLVSNSVDIPVLISGGAGKWEDFVNGFEKANASAVCTSCIYHFTEASIKSAKNYLKNKGIEVRA